MYKHLHHGETQTHFYHKPSIGFFLPLMLQMPSSTVQILSDTFPLPSLYYMGFFIKKRKFYTTVAGLLLKSTYLTWFCLMN